MMVRGVQGRSVMPVPFERAKWRAAVASGQGGVTWLVTFVDLISLLLAFFVLLFSMSAPDPPRWETLVLAMRGTLDPGKTTEKAGGPEELSVRTERPGRGLSLGYVERLLETAATRAPELKAARTRMEADRLVLELPSDLIFRPGAATLTPSGARSLHVLATLFVNLSNRIDVLGHTDPNPMGLGGPFISNWDLSLARAAAVADALAGSGYDKEMVVRGAAASRFAEIDPTLDRTERFARARRVDLIIHRRRHK